MKMKANNILLSIITVLYGVAGAAHAQIRDNQSSVAVLSVQCAVSSGSSVDAFNEYSGRLAKTLALLSSAQQTRVFGYLPQPGGFSEEDDIIPSSPVVMPKESVPTAEAGALDNLVGLVGDFNTAMSGSGEGSSGVYAGVAEEDTSGIDALLADESSQDPPKGGSSWGAFMALLKKAEAAYKEGTLRTFLKDNQ